MSSSAVCDSSTRRTMNKGDLDFSYLTTRLAVMSFPAEGMESAIRNHIDDVKAFLEARHDNAYAVYNLSQRSYRAIKFQNRVSTTRFFCGVSCMLKILDSHHNLCSFRSPSVASLPRKLLRWLLCSLYARTCTCGCDKIKRIFVLCTAWYVYHQPTSSGDCVFSHNQTHLLWCLQDGKSASATVVGAFMCYCRLFDDVNAAMHMFTARRGPPGISASQKRYLTLQICFTVSQLGVLLHGSVSVLRYIEYIGEMVSDEPHLPHHRPLMLVSINMSPIPLFNRMRLVFSDTPQCLEGVPNSDFLFFNFSGVVVDPLLKFTLERRECLPPPKSMRGWGGL